MQSRKNKEWNMDQNRFVLIGVTKETRELLRQRAEVRRTKIYQLVQTLVEADAEKILPTKVNIDRAAPATDHEPQHKGTEQ